MSKELFVSSTPHETKVAIVEEDQLAEIYFERENEYTLAGSIYKGKVTRVLPGMQSAFVEIGLERDAFLYVTDFVEPQEEDGEIETIPHGDEQQASEEPSSDLPGESRRGGRRGRGDRGRHQQQRQQPAHEEASAAPENGDSAPFVISNDFDESDSSELTEAVGEPGAEADGNSEEQITQRTQRPSDGQDDGPRRWRGRRRRGGRRGRGDRDERPAAPQASHQETPRAEAPRQEAPPQRSYQPIILPGESLSKYRRQQQQQPQHNQQQSSSEPAQPVTEAFTPEELGHTAPRFDSHESEPNRGSHNEFVDPAGRVLLNAEEHEARMAASAGTAPFRQHHESNEQQPEREERHQQRGEQHDEQREQAFRSHAFGAGAMEEEQIEEEEEAETAGSFMQEMEEEGYEELEEETLDRTPAPAAHAHHAEQTSEGDETADVTEAVRDAEVEETTGRYAAEGMDEDDSDSEGTEEQFEESEEMVSAAGEESEGDNIGNQSDENSEGRAEVRGPSGYSPRVAPERARRGGRDNRRGGRGRFQKGGGGGGGPRGRRNFRMPLPQIGDLLKEGQEILVQIAKEPIGKKGARITSHIALPGRYLVYMPTVNHNGVSRKISSEEERQRLKRIINSERENQTGGFIVRTAAEHVSEEDLRNDIRFLLNLWHEIKGRAESSKAPALIYHDLNLVERILRDQVSGSFSHIWVDTEAEYERVLRFVSRFQPTLVKRVKLYTKETPLFEQFNIQDEINKALKSKVWLKSGGYIVINQTEALVAIDINTGKYVGKTQRLEDTIVKTNVDAIKEIVRQIRLRDLGGIIVIDFIDMDERRNRQKVMQELELALKADRAPSKVLQFNDFGLVAITRKRVKQSLERTLGAPCTYCTGTGLIKSVTTVANEIYVEMRKMTKHLEGKDVIVRVNPEVAKALKANNARWLSDMEELTGRNIIVKSDVTLHQEQFDIH